MKNKHHPKSIRWLLPLTLICVTGGALFYAIQQEWLFFLCLRPRTTCTATTLQGTHAIAARKKVTLHFWQNEHWVQETQELVWPTDKAQALTYLLNSWCTLLEEEHVIDHKISIQSLLLAHNGSQALISFDRIPFLKESSTFAKWMLLEGLLRTLRKNKAALSEVIFLVRHQPLRDYHLDFSKPWPIQGFFDQQS